MWNTTLYPEAMFHAEMRSGTHVVREFNLDDRALWVRYLAPLLDGREFVREGHEWTPNKTRLMILEGPELRLDQISMGRGWPNAQRSGKDVTGLVLARARELHGRASDAESHTPPLAPEPEPPSVAGARILRERLIGRLGAGPATAEQIEALAAGAMPGADPAALRAACERAVWELLAAGEAQLAAGEAQLAESEAQPAESER